MMAALAGPEATDEAEVEAGAADSSLSLPFLPWLSRSLVLSVVVELDEESGLVSMGPGGTVVGGIVVVTGSGASVVVVVSSSGCVVVVLAGGPVVVVVVSGGEGPVPSTNGGATGLASSLASTGRSEKEALSIGGGISSTQVRPGSRRA